MAEIVLGRSTASRSYDLCVGDKLLLHTRVFPYPPGREYHYVIKGRDTTDLADSVHVTQRLDPSHPKEADLTPTIVSFEFTQRGDYILELVQVDLLHEFQTRSFTVRVHTQKCPKPEVQCK